MNTKTKWIIGLIGAILLAIGTYLTSGCKTMGNAQWDMQISQKQMELK